MKSPFLALLSMVLMCASVSCMNEVPPGNQQIKEGTTSATAVPSSEKQGTNETTTVKAGYYEMGHPDEIAVAEFLGKSSVAVWLSWHNGISLENSSGKGWDNKLTLDQLKERLETIVDKTQAVIVLEKNFTGENKEDEAVADLLVQLGFETIVVQSCHSNATVIDKIIRRSK